MPPFSLNLRIFFKTIICRYLKNRKIIQIMELVLPLRLAVRDVDINFAIIIIYGMSVLTQSMLFAMIILCVDDDEERWFRDLQACCILVIYYNILNIVGCVSDCLRLYRTFFNYQSRRLVS